MSRYNMSLSAAYNFSKSRRPEVSPNSSFMKYLERYGEELKQKRLGNSNTTSNNNNTGNNSPVNNLPANTNRGHYAYSQGNLNAIYAENGKANRHQYKYTNSVSPANTNGLQTENKSFFYDNTHMNINANANNNMNSFKNEPNHQHMTSPYPSIYGFDKGTNTNNKPSVSMFGYDTNNNNKLNMTNPSNFAQKIAASNPSLNANYPYY